VLGKDFGKEYDVFPFTVMPALVELEMDHDELVTSVFERLQQVIEHQGHESQVRLALQFAWNVVVNRGKPFAETEWLIQKLLGLHSQEKLTGSNLIKLY
jgi:hypothetical protein